MREDWTMAQCFEDLESVRAAFGLWPGIRFRCAVCGQPHGVTEIHEWVRCATHLGREWGVEAFPRAEKWLWLRGWVDYTFKPPLIIAITRPEEVQRTETLLREKRPQGPVVAESYPELLALRRDVLERMLRAAWDRWWEAVAQYTRDAVRAAYELDPRELPQDQLFSGRTYEARAVKIFARCGVTVAVARLGVCLTAPPGEWVTGTGLVAHLFSAGLTLRYAFPEGENGRAFNRDPFWLAQVVDSAVGEKAINR